MPNPMSTSEIVNLAKEEMSQYRRVSKKTVQLLIAALQAQGAEAVCHVFPDDLERLRTSECAVTCYSVEMGDPDRGETVPLFDTAPPAQAARVPDDPFKPERLFLKYADQYMLKKGSKEYVAALNAFTVAYRMASAGPAPAAEKVSEQAANIVEAVCAELTWVGWRSAESRDKILQWMSELRSMLSAVPTQEQNADNYIAQKIHYPKCWDTIAYPTLASAVWEFVDGDRRCSECDPAAPVNGEKGND